MAILIISGKLVAERMSAVLRRGTKILATTNLKMMVKWKQL
jgi:hypothetical protein